MQILKTIKDMQALSRTFIAGGKTIGFVPTMGALHEGHLSLVKRSKRENNATAVSIFVNPAQFGPKEDFRQYPRYIERDLVKLSLFGADAVFIPEADEMYPQGSSTIINVGNIGEKLCGASRPGHFNGVATVVSKLFNIVMPHKAYFGQKDFQQTVVIKKLARELNFDIEIMICPTIREADGLAMSSRNMYLNPAERKAAPVLYDALKRGKSFMDSGVKEVSFIIEALADLLNSEPLATIDYIELVEPEGLEKIEMVKLPTVLCLAVKIGATRLIDNMAFTP
ncbi:MAG: pantoate--beta-alanine ligase [Nitrospirae bacterium]|nr:pantoate--beta-alanine ligase [Nitrospirota bacterium]